MYSEACARVGYDHAARPAVQLTEIGSPVTRKAFGEAIKQISAVAREYGLIDFVHIELARDVGKSAEERAKFKKGIEKRTAEKEKRRDEAAEHLGARAKRRRTTALRTRQGTEFQMHLFRRSHRAQGCRRQRYPLSGRSYTAVEPLRRQFLSQQDALHDDRPIRTNAGARRSNGSMRTRPSPSGWNMSRASRG